MGLTAIFLCMQWMYWNFLFFAIYLCDGIDEECTRESSAATIALKWLTWDGKHSSTWMYALAQLHSFSWTSARAFCNKCPRLQRSLLCWRHVYRYIPRFKAQQRWWRRTRATETKMLQIDDCYCFLYFSNNIFSSPSSSSSSLTLSSSFHITFHRARGKKRSFSVMSWLKITHTMSFMLLTAQHSTIVESLP